MPPRLWSVLRERLAVVSPRRRRWLRFLADLPLAPDSLPSPCPEPPAGDFVICGCPRSGTTLLAAQLFQPPRIVTVMEPWDGMRLPPAKLFASLRSEVVESGHLRRGKLDVAALLSEGVVRWCDEGDTTPPLVVEGDFRLGVKWPTYWQLLAHLPSTRFLVCIRNPIEVVNSFRHQGGRLEQGLEYDTRFNRRLNRDLATATIDRTERRALLWERAHAAVLPHLDRANVLPVRYERWFEDPDGLRREIGAFLDLELGTWPATIRAPSARGKAAPEDLRAVQRLCPSAVTLGYPVDVQHSERT